MVLPDSRTPLERVVVFSRDVISEYIQHGCPSLTPTSGGTMRSRLLRVSEALLPRSWHPSVAVEPASDGREEWKRQSVAISPEFHK